MKQKHIFFVLVYIDEAHSIKWPIGINHPLPQSNFQDRLDNAKNFASSHHIDENAFTVVVDDWDNLFAETFQAWPDKYYMIDANYKVLAKSEYGSKADALINVDCVELIRQMV